MRPVSDLDRSGRAGEREEHARALLRSLIDPNSAPLRSKPRNEEDLLIAATNGWLVALDNLSSISDDLSDALCRLSTGGGLGTRTLYTNADEMIFSATRAVILNGIEDLATRGDLVDRAVIIELPRIPKRGRKSETAFWREFEAAAPRILGALLDVVVTALRDEPSVNLAEPPRMADFATWGAAAAPALGWTADQFLSAYEANRRQADDAPLQTSPLTKPLQNLHGRQEFLARDGQCAARRAAEAGERVDAEGKGMAEGRHASVRRPEAVGAESAQRRA